MWNQSISGVGSEIQLDKMKGNLMGFWQPGPDGAFSVPTASNTPAGSSVRACKMVITVAPSSGC